MTYQVLARKWRPQDFSQVVGQKPIVTALSNALKEGKVAQAYLFSGIRGVGKTSVARILAKALNCERGPTATPCGQCTSCQEISSGTGPLDVIEVDAATYSKVEQIRELTESLKYGPARDAYKVVILDEIHRLSRQAFDALLKIVEEPPDHLVFIFATTEIESVPATILSRCQEFRFHRVAFDELIAHLERLAAAEGIEAGPSALRLIARASDGSVRDAVALLDQLATFGSGRIEDDAAAGILGGVDSKLFLSLLRRIVEGRSADVSTTVLEIEDQGWDPRYVYSEFLQYCRSALHLALGADEAQIDLPREESAELASLALDCGYENILRLLHLLLAGEETVRRSENGLLAVEISWLRGAELPKLVAIERLLTGAPPEQPPETGPVETERKRRSAGDGNQVPTETPAAPQKRHSDPRSREKATEGVAGNNGDKEDSGVEKTPPGPLKEAFLARISTQNQALAAHLAAALELDFTDGELQISVAVGDTWIRERLENKRHSKTLEKAISATWGDPPRWKILEKNVEAPATENEETVAAADDPQVQKILDIFGGSIESAAEGDQ